MTTVLGEVPAGATTVEEVVRHRLAEGVGGVRGSVEAALPTVAFVVLWSTTHRMGLALGAAAVCVLLALAARLVQGQSPRFALSSLAALAVAAFFALRSGRAQDAFLPGIIASCGLCLLSVLSVLTRYPMVGFVLGAAHPDDPLGWRRDRGVVRLCQRLTAVLAGLYAVRAVIMLPLYLAGQVTWLGVCKIVLGWPLYLVALAVMGALLLTGRTPLDPPDVRDVPDTPSEV